MAPDGEEERSGRLERLRRVPGRARSRGRRVVDRVRQVERRELREFRRWIETTTNLVHVSALVAVPVLVALVTWLSNAVDQISFLLFPPLASGTYTLFADPEGRYSSPKRFVGGMSVGAFCGWVALEVAARFLSDVPPASLEVHAGAAALGVVPTASRFLSPPTFQRIGDVETDVAVVHVA